MRTVVLSASPEGRVVAEGLPYEHHHGALASLAADHWGAADAIVCVSDVAVARTAAATSETQTMASAAPQWSAASEARAP